MEHQNPDTTLTSKNKASKLNPETSIASLIETVELLRRNKIQTRQSYSEVFFSAAKDCLG